MNVLAPHLEVADFSERSLSVRHVLESVEDLLDSDDVFRLTIHRAPNDAIRLAMEQNKLSWRQLNTRESCRDRDWRAGKWECRLPLMSTVV